MADHTSLRADAERNRQRVVDAACELFGTAGLDVPLEEVAKRAGVGIATLYRRFPTRGELIAAAFAQKISGYLAVVDRAVAQDDPWQGLVDLVEGLCALQANDAGMRDLLMMSFPDVPEVDALAHEAQVRVDALLERAKAAGRVRADAVPEDLALIVLGNAEVVARTHEKAPDSWRRYAALMVEGLRARPDAVPLPPPPATQDLRAALRH